MLEIEHQHWDKGLLRLAGVDEAGRGPLAGPVVAAAVIINRSLAESEEHGFFKGLTDSKKLSPKRRETFFHMLNDSPDIEVGVGVSDVEEIDEINILRATHKAMARAVRDLTSLPDHILLDGLAVSGLPCSSTPIVKGDSKSLSIAAASIVAKVVRDNRMLELDKIYPEYNFAKHKGYGTSMHMEALFEHGPCEIHRVSFKPVRQAMKLHE